MTSINKKKITWLLLLQGWTMLWVVIGHSPLSISTTASVFDVNCSECAHFLFNMAYSFHMPLFIMISGYLFFITRINKDISYKKTLFDKFVRLGIPYVFFIGLAFFVKYYVGGVQRPVSLSAESFFQAFVWPFDGPLQEMWFIAAILICFSLLGFYRRIMGVKYLPEICLCCTVGLFFIPVDSMSGVFAFNRAVHFFLFFFVGILLAAKDLTKILNRTSCIVIFALLYIVSYPMRGGEFYSLISSLSGCFLFWGLAHKLDEIISQSIFNSFRNYTYQIFLLGIFIQIGVKIIYNKLDLPNTYLIFFMLCVICGLYIPVLISKLFQRINNKFLNRLIGL